MRSANDMIYGRRARHGLGETTFDQNKGLIQAGLSQIPYVGPILSAIAGSLDSVFGWGDPNSIADLMAALVQSRLALAVARHQAGIEEDFHLPPGYDGSESESADLGMVIINEYLHKVPTTDDDEALAATWTDGTNLNIPGHPVGAIWTAYPSSEQRSDAYKVLGMIKADLTSLQTENANAILTGSSPYPLPTSSSAPSALAPPLPAPLSASSSPATSSSSSLPPATASSPAPAPNQVASLENMAPLAIGAGVVMLSVFAVIAISHGQRK